MGRRTKYISKLIENSGIAKNRFVIVKNKQTKSFGGVINIDQPDIFNIQLWWQIGISHVEQEGGRFVAIISDDVELKTNQLRVMLQELLDWKVAMVSSKVSRKYGWGHAFILDLQSGIRPDTRLKWYYGDYDLKYQAKRKGGFKTSTQEIVHLEPGTNTKNHIFLSKLIEDDKRIFREKYPIRFFLVTIYNHSVNLSKQKVRRLCALLRFPQYR